MTDRLIRPAEEDDLAAIVAIYNDVMRTSFTIWREAPTSIAERRDWLAETSTMGYPVLVATDSGRPHHGRRHRLGKRGLVALPRSRGVPRDGPHARGRSDDLVLVQKILTT